MANHSPRSSGSGGDSVSINGPQPKRGLAGRGVASPWTQVVRGAESESTISSSAPSAVVVSSSVAAIAPSSSSAPLEADAAQRQISSPSCELSPPKDTAEAVASSSSSSSSPDDSAADAHTESSDNSTDSSNATKKPAWNKPSNGAVEVGPVMGAVSWPALSESTRPTPKSASSESLKVSSDGSDSVSQGIGIASSPLKQVSTNNVNPSLTTNHVKTVRQKSMKHGDGSSSGSFTANSDLAQQPPPQGPMVEMPSTSRKPGPVAESSSRDHTQRESGQRGGYVSQPHTGNDHQVQRNSFKRVNGPNHRGDGSYHHNHVARRDHERGNHDWNPHRSFSSRDGHFHGTFLRGPPHSPPPFITPPAVHFPPYGAPMAYPDMGQRVIYYQGLPPEPFRGMPMVPPISPYVMYNPFMDPKLRNDILNQINYYFSNENLIKDTFLRQNMDEQGWVPIKLIAGFRRVMLLTDNIQLILDVLRNSNVVEVQVDKVRRRNDWNRWIMPPVQSPTASSPRVLERPSRDMLASNIQRMSLVENNNQGETEASLNSRSLSVDLNSQFQSFSVVEGMGQTTAQAGF